MTRPRPPPRPPASRVRGCGARSSAARSALRDALWLSASKGTTPYPQVAWVDGIENPAEAFPNIVRWLVTHGYSDDDIGKAVGGNIMRVLDEVWVR